MMFFQCYKFVTFQLVLDYYRIIQRPMDLQTIRENLRQKKYQSREEFLADINQIVENSKLYNGMCLKLMQSAVFLPYVTDVHSIHFKSNSEKLENFPLNV